MLLLRIKHRRTCRITPYIINLDGDRIRVTPKITLQDTQD